MIPIGSSVKLEGTSYDRYKRLLSEIYTLNGLNVNLEMVRTGFAMTYYLNINKNCKLKKDVYLDHEKFAKESKLNIWSDSLFVPPWEYRKIKKKKHKNEL